MRQNTTISAILRDGGEPVWTHWLYRLLYRYADGIICQSQAMAADMAVTIKLPRERISVLPNPIDPAAKQAARDQALHWSGPGPHLLAVGRLAPEKGFDLLLEALARVRKEFPAADLTIAGSGGHEGRLRAQCRRLGLEGYVRFAGQVKTPYAFYPGASAFVLPSRYEGMPNALLEAGVAGLPIIALPSSGGVVDLLREWPGTWMAVEISEHALGEVLLRALAEIHPGQRFSRDWDYDRAIRGYEQLIEAAPAEGRA